MEAVLWSPHPLLPRWPDCVLRQQLSGALVVEAALAALAAVMMMAATASARQAMSNLAGPGGRGWVMSTVVSRRQDLSGFAWMKFRG